MKITICSEDEPGRIGGPWAWLPRFVHGLEAQGVEVNLIFFHALKATDCEHLQYFINKGNKVSYKSWHSLTQRADNTEDRVKWILRQIEQDPPDIFVPNLVMPALYAARWLKEAGIPSIGILHSDDPFFYKVAKVFWEGPEVFRLSALVCVSKEIEENINESYPDHGPVFRIPYMVPIPAGKAARNDRIMEVAYSGRIIEKQKRISRVAEAFAGLVRKVPGTKCYLYGSGPEEQTVRDIIAANDAGDHVIMRGAIKSNVLQNELLKHQVFTLISDYEGIPIALLEAMACGLVPVCKRIDSGLPEVVIDGETGYLFDDSKDEYPEIIKKLKNDPELWERLSEHAKELIVNQYSEQALIKKWMEAFNYLLKDSKKPEIISFPEKIDIPRELLEVFTGQKKRERTGAYLAGQVRRVVHFIGRKLR